MRRRSLLIWLGLLGGCPTGREQGGGVQGAEPSTSAQHVAQKPASSNDPVGAVPASEEARVVALVSGEALAADAQPDSGEVFGVEARFDVRPMGLAAPGAQLGAVTAAISALQTASLGSLVVQVGAGRTRVRFGARTFAMEDGDVLVGDRRRAGWLLVRGTSYRIVPPGALRPLLAERRFDVVPLATSRALAAPEVTVAGRTASRVVVATTYGTLQLDQIKIEPPRPPAGRDAGPEAGLVSPSGIDGAGESLCRALLELVASELSLGGAPCTMDRVPVRAEVVFARGGGLVIEATSVREGPIARSLLAFPPSASKLATEPLGDLPAWAPLDLLPLRAKGDPSALDLSAPLGLSRIAFVDGVPNLVAGPRALALRSGRYSLEWRTPLLEQLEPPTEVVVPGKAHASIGPWPNGSAAPIASLRTPL